MSELRVAGLVDGILGRGADVTIEGLGGGAGRGIWFENRSTGPMTVLGTPFDDCIVMHTSGDPVAFGGDGDDRMITHQANTSFHGGAGNDRLFATGSASGTFHGGAGNDLLHTKGGSSFTFFGDAGDDVLYGAGNGSGTFDGGAGDDVLWVGPSSHYVLRGGPGDDHLRSPETNGWWPKDGGPGHDVCDGAGPPVACEAGTAVSGSAGSSMLLLDEGEADPTATPTEASPEVTADETEEPDPSTTVEPAHPRDPQQPQPPEDPGEPGEPEQPTDE